MRQTLSDLVPQLPRRAWKVLAADSVAAIGTGLVLPFMVVYLRDVRGFDVQTAAFVLSVLAITGVVFGAPLGSLVDRLGPRRMLIASLLLCATASATFSQVQEPWQAFTAAVFLGLGFAGLWPATHSLLSSMVGPEHRSSVFSVHYATLNLGIGIGGIAGGTLANVARPGTFELLYVLDAVSWLVFAAVLLVMRDIGNRVEHSEEDEEIAAGGYGTVLRDRNFVRLFVVMTLLVTIGYAQLESGFPAYATGEGGISTTALGMSFAANTFSIVVAQLVVLKLMRGRRRTRGLMGICLLWAAAWSLALLVGQLGGGILKNAGFALVMVVFGMGECLVSPTVPAMLNDLAPDALRGRYNAAYSFTFSAGHIVGPAVAGVFLGRGLGDELFVVLTLTSLATIALVRNLERHVPEAANRVSEDAPPAGSPVDPEVELARA
ncbi:MAG TPA: MFS transporter [Actinomycetota bacterium]|nr:MFS transporter [Actinomycetota bacterium]